MKIAEVGVIAPRVTSRKSRRKTRVERRKRKGERKRKDRNHGFTRISEPLILFWIEEEEDDMKAINHGQHGVHGGGETCEVESPHIFIHVIPVLSHVIPAHAGIHRKQ